MIKRFFNHKIWGILLAFVTVLTLVLLAAGLSDLHFQPARPLGWGETRAIRFSVDRIVEEIAKIPFWKQIVFWVLAFFLVIIIASLFSPELRKRIIMYFLRFALFVIALFYILQNYRRLFPAFNFGGRPLTEGGAPIGAEAAPPVFAPPQVSSSLVYFVSLAVILTLAAVAFLMGRWWLRRHRSRKTPRSLEDLAEIARSSLADILAGKDWEDAIIQCYARMSNVVEAKRGLHRQKGMTPSEFAARLEWAGLPGDAVRRLTHLFESVRYGARKSSPEEVDEAVACLTTVLNACGASR